MAEVYAIDVTFNFISENHIKNFIVFSDFFSVFLPQKNFKLNTPE